MNNGNMKIKVEWQHSWKTIFWELIKIEEIRPKRQGLYSNSEAYMFIPGLQS